MGEALKRATKVVRGLEQPTQGGSIPSCLTSEGITIGGGIVRQLKLSEFVVLWQAECEEWHEIARELCENGENVTAYTVSCVQNSRAKADGRQLLDFCNTEIVEG